MRTSSTTKKLIAGGALVLAGFGAGAALAVTGSASASSDGATGTESSGTTGGEGRAFDPSRSIRPDEHLLTGTTAGKVRAAALAKYPHATIQRVETDSDGVYEAHIVTSDGRELIVQVGKDFKVTGTQEGHGRGDGRRGHHDDGDDDRDGTGPSQSAFGA